MHEHDIRDYVAQNLDGLWPGLRLVAKEYPLELTSGTRAYIDVLATFGRKYVIIEIKRLDQSARATTNEIAKYVEGLKLKLSLNDDDIQIFVVSTTWRELTIPFAYMASRLGIPCRGFIIEWDGSVRKCSEVTIPRIAGARLFSPHHGFCYYHVAADAEKGLRSHENVFPGRGITDYVVVKLRAPEGLHEQLALANRAHVTALGLSPSIFDGRDERFDYVLYSAFLRKDLDAYRSMLSRDPDVLETTEALLDDEMTEDDRLSLFEHATFDLEPFPYSNYVETGYPEKFAGTLLRDQRWEIDQIYRYGSIAQNQILSDEDIVSEISGHQGVDKGRVRSSAAVSNAAELSRLQSEVVRCLADDNVAWREQLLFVLRELGTDPTLQECSIQLDLMSPNNFIVGLFYQVRDPEFGYLPSYELAVRDVSGRVVKLFVGRLVWSGKEPDFDLIVQNHFNGDVFKLVMTLCWGGFLDHDERVITDLGLSYGTFAVRLAADGAISAADVLENFRFVEGMEAFGSFERFVLDNPGFIAALADRVGRHVAGGSFFTGPDSAP